MYKKAGLLLAALLFLIGAHLRPSYDYELHGVCIASGVAPGAAKYAERVFRETAEEILPADAVLPVFCRRLHLGFSRPSDDVRAVTDALLRSTEGIVLRDEVRVNGVRLGWVSDGDALREALEAYISNTLPVWASGGRLSREPGIRRLYTRDGYLTPPGDMVLLITGAAPVFYYDQTGRYARA